MEQSVLGRTTAVNPSIAAALGGIVISLAIAAAPIAHAQTDPSGVDNSAYGELVGERYKNEEAPKGQSAGRAEKGGTHQKHDAKKGSARSSSQNGAGREDKPANSPSEDQKGQRNR